MKSANPYPIHPEHLQNATALQRAQTQDPAVPPVPPRAATSTARTPRRDCVNPVDYQHPYESMGRFAQALALRYDDNSTRHAYYRQLRLIQQVDPDVWGKKWGVHIQAAGNGGAALRYLGTYVARTAIADTRMLRVEDATVTSRWKNRDAGNRRETCTLPGVEFVARYLRHALPRGLRTIRYYGLCHPAARTKRLRVQCRAGGPVQMGASTPVLAPTAPIPLCPCCRRPMRLAAVILAPYLRRGPPATLTTDPSHPTRS